MLVEKVKETLEGGLPPLREEAMAAREDSAPGVEDAQLLGVDTMNCVAK